VIKKGRLLRKIYLYHFRCFRQPVVPRKNRSRIVYLIACQRIASINYFVFKIDGEIIEEHAQGDGQFDAFMNALAKYIKNLELPRLIDYAVGFRRK
jgi:hypothetical protein